MKIDVKSNIISVKVTDHELNKDMTLKITKKFLRYSNLTRNDLMLYLGGKILDMIEEMEK